MQRLYERMSRMWGTIQLTNLVKSEYKEMVKPERCESVYFDIDYRVYHQCERPFGHEGRHLAEWYKKFEWPETLKEKKNR